MAEGAQANHFCHLQHAALQEALMRPVQQPHDPLLL